VRYFLTSFVVHVFILLFCLLNLDSIDMPGGSGGSQSSAVAYSLEGLNKDSADAESLKAQDTAKQTVEKTPAKTEENEDVAATPKEVIKIADPNKKEEPAKKKSVEKQPQKELNLKQKKERLKQAKGPSNKDIDKKTSKAAEKNDGKEADKNKADGEGNGVGNGKGKGDGDGFGEGNTKGKGKGDGKAAKEAEEAALAQAVYDIQTKIMQFWFPPEEFAARQDIVIVVELKLDQAGNILAYKLVDAKETIEYRAVAASVLRVLNDPRVTPLPIGNNKKLSNIILKFCPRDLL